MFSYREKQSMQMNYKRLNFISKQLVKAYREGVQHQPHCWATRYVHDVIENGFGKLGLDWATSIIEDGRTVHTVTQYLAYCRRDKVVRSMMALTGSLLHAREKRPDCFAVIALINDVNVENSNSCTQRCLPNNTIHTAPIVSRAAQVSWCKREFLPRRMAKTEHRGEIYEEEVKYKKPKAVADQQVIAGFLTRYMRRLENICSPDPNPRTTGSAVDASLAGLAVSPAPHAAPQMSRAASTTSGPSNATADCSTEPTRVNSAALYSIADCCKHGAQRLREEIAPNFEKYLKNEKRKSDRNNQQQRQQQGREGGVAEQEAAEMTEEYKRDDAYLRQFSKPALQGYLRSIAVPCTKYNIDGLVKYICDTRQREQFSQFIVDNKIYSHQEAVKYVESKMKSRKAVARQQQQQQRQEQQQEGKEDQEHQQEEGDESDMDGDL